MKKYLVGLVFGLLLICTVTAYAGGGMVGKAVEAEFPLWLHGNKLEKSAIVIEGVSYLPVRAIGEKLDLDVEFKNGQIFLNNKERKVLPRHNVMSDVVKVNQPEFYIVRDGEWYYTVAAFGDYLGFDGKNNMITMPWGKTVILNKSSEYYTGITSFVEYGRSFVSLTALGLKPVINGDTVTLERIQ